MANYHLTSQVACNYDAIRKVQPSPLDSVHTENEVLGCATIGWLTGSLPKKALPSWAMFLDALRSAFKLNPHFPHLNRLPCLLFLFVFPQTLQVWLVCLGSTKTMFFPRASALYSRNYHLVWCPKYRKKILRGGVKEKLKDCANPICESKNWELLELNIQPDHLHLFLSAPPYDSPMGIIKILKGVTAIQLFKQIPILKAQLRKGHVWSPSYYIGTAGHVSAETIQKYIQNQERR